MALIGIIIGIVIVYFILSFFGISILVVAKRYDEDMYLARKKYLDKAKETGELDIETIKKLSEENDELLK